MDDAAASRSLTALVRCLDVVAGVAPVPVPGESRNLDDAMDEFIEEHRQCYDFRDDGPDRYAQVLLALKAELRRVALPACGQATGGQARGDFNRIRALRVLQCLRLLTRDPDLQYSLFEEPDREPRPSAERAVDGLRGRELRREGSTREDGKDRCRERVVFPPLGPPPTAPPNPGRGERHGPTLHPPTYARQLPSASSHRRVGQRQSRTPVRRLTSQHGEESLAAEVATPEGDRGLRLPPLESLSRGRPASAAQLAAVCVQDSTGVLLRLMTELVDEYIEESEDGDQPDAHAGGLDMRLTLLSIAEIVGMLNLYATVEAHRSRLARLGALGPLTRLLSRWHRLLSRASDSLVLRCALETLVHLTADGNMEVLNELARLSLRDAEESALAPNIGHPTDLLGKCVELLGCHEDTYECLAASLLEHLLASADLRAQLRRFRAIPRVLVSLEAAVGVAGVASEIETPPPQAKKVVCVLRCCQQLAADHVQLGDPMAVHELREHGALHWTLLLASRLSRDGRDAETLLAALDCLAEMCKDDECATALRREHSDGFRAVGLLLLDHPWRPPGPCHPPEPDADVLLSVQCSAARLLRFLYSVEINRDVFKIMFPHDVLGPFVDVGNYVWPLEDYQPLMAQMNSLSERDVAFIRANLVRCAEYSGRDRGRKRIIRGYELLEVLGSGAFGRVWLARKEDALCEFALKEMHLTAKSDSVSVPPTQRNVAQQAPAANSPTPPGQRGRGRPGSGGGRCSTPRLRGARHPSEAPAADGRAQGARAIVPDPSAEDVSQEDVSQEVRLLRQCDHPNIVRYYSSFSTAVGAGSTRWIVMEFCRGVSLQRFTASAREKGIARRPEEQTWRIFVQISIALRYLHTVKGIAHRDLTPNNVLVEPHTLSTKLTDFGLARQKSLVGSRMSMMASMVGTIVYSCPEIVQNRRYTHKADVWSLGCLLYKMAMFTDPFHGTNHFMVAKNIVECKYPRLDPSWHTDLLIKTIEKCLTVSPEERPDIKSVCALISPHIIQEFETLQADAVQLRQEAARRRLPAPVRPPSAGRPQVGAPQAERDALPTLPALKEDDKDCHRPAPPKRAASLESSLATQSVESAYSLASEESEGRSTALSTALSVHTALSLRCSPSPEIAAALVEAASRPRESKAADAGIAEIEEVLLLTHRLAFLGALRLTSKPDGCGRPDPKVGSHNLRHMAVGRYHRWLFGGARHAKLVRRETARLARRSRELVDCLGPGGEATGGGDEFLTISLTYERLHEYIFETCAEHGYDDASDSDD